MVSSVGQAKTLTRWQRLTEWRSDSTGTSHLTMMKVAFKMLVGQVPRLSAYEYIKAWRQEIAQAQSQGWGDQSSLHLGQLLLDWSLKKGMRGLLWKWPQFRRLHQCIKVLKLLTIADWLVLEYIRLTSYLRAQIAKDLAFDAGFVKSCYCADSAFTIYHHVFYCCESVREPGFLRESYPPLSM